MRLKCTFLFVFIIAQFSFLSAQNYLRAQGPDNWGIFNSQQPGWQEWSGHGIFTDVSIILEPQGLYTEVGFYATITHSPDAWTWSGEYEIIWQFELPSNAIVHDSWLWVGDDIIRADMVDYWTALQTYEDIVDRNEDPSFFYQLPDNRYEIRIYPLFEGETRRIKMSFLVPAQWEDQTIVSDVLHHLLQSTDYVPELVNIGIPVNETWGVPSLNLDGEIITFTDTVVASTGEPLHYLVLDGHEFVYAEEVNLVSPAPYTNNSFLSTYSQDGEQYYQLAFTPDWAAVDNNSQLKKSLLLLDYNSSKTSLSKVEFVSQLAPVLLDHFSQQDALNIAVMSTTGIQFLVEGWWLFDENTFADELTNILNLQDTVDLVSLLSDGFSWAQNQIDVSHLYLLAANDNYVFPPIADDIFEELTATLPTGIPFTLLDYQDENTSILFYNDEEYHGNEYFYDLLANSFDESSAIVFRDLNESHSAVFLNMFPALGYPEGILDYTTTLENGICYQRHSLNTSDVTANNEGSMYQVGKFLGDFPMNIEANLIKNNGEILTINHTIEASEIIAGDTLMQEMWYGSQLKMLESQSSSASDNESIIQQSIDERVLTGLTAFLALEPSQGGEPCIACLLNAGGLIIATEAVFDTEEVELLITPNPASGFAKIIMKYKDNLSPQDWNVRILDTNGRPITDLGKGILNNGALEWAWIIGDNIQAGIYICEIQSQLGKVVGKVVVI